MTTTSDPAVTSAKRGGVQPARLRAGRVRRTAPTTRHSRQPSSLPYIPAEAGRKLAALARYGGWTGIAAYIGICAYCFSTGERDSVARYFGVPTDMVTLDLKSGILPACLIGVLTATIKPDRNPAAPSRRRRIGAAVHWLMHHERGDLPRRAPSFERAVRISMPTVFVLLTIATGPALAVTAGDYVGRSEAGSDTWLNVVSDPRLCPPATPSTTTHQSCVIVARSNGQAITRWINDTTGQLTTNSLTWSAPASGYISTTTWFPAVLPVNPPHTH
jgi:hypothetical protein